MHIYVHVYIYMLLYLFIFEYMCTYVYVYIYILDIIVYRTWCTFFIVYGIYLGLEGLTIL